MIRPAATRSLARPAFFKGLVLAFLMLLPAVRAATYYVSPAGNDNNNGTSTSTPWRTMANVQAHAWSPGFQPGDRILFQGGQTFTGTIYIQLDKTKGTAANPIVFGSYGTGRATLQASTGSSVFNVWAPASGTVGLGMGFENLKIVGTLGRNYGILVYSDNTTTLDYLRIEQCEVTGAGGDGISIGRTATDKGHFTNVVIRHVLAHSNSGTSGLTNPTGSGIVLGGADGGLIEHCIAYNNGANNTNSAGPVGIWLWDSQNTIIQFCESYDNKSNGGDGGGFDIDGGSSNCIIQYNYSHNNVGPGFLYAQYLGAAPLTNNHIRYNISQNDGRKGNYGGIQVWGHNSSTGVSNSYIYNNVVFISPPASGQAYGLRAWDNYAGVKVWNNIFHLDGVQTAVTVNRNTSGIHFQNNIYHRTNGTPRFISAGTTYDGIAAWRASGNELWNGQNVGSESNPLVNNPGNAGTLNNTSLLATLTHYQIQAGSPAIDMGLNLQTAFSINPGSRDFYGNSIPRGGQCDIGVHETESEIVVNPIPDQQAVVGTAFSYAFPENTFTNIDNVSLTYTATLADDSALPAWLSFNPDTRTFSGTPSETDIGSVSVKLTAADSGGLSAQDSFSITVGNAPTPYQIWAADLSDPDPAAVLNDAGLNNLLAFALDLDPTADGLNSIHPTGLAGPGVFDLITRERKNSGLLIDLESSTSLLTWYPIPSERSVLESLTDTADRVRYRVTLDSEDTLIFLRIRIRLP